MYLLSPEMLIKRYSSCIIAEKMLVVHECCMRVDVSQRFNEETSGKEIFFAKI